MIKIKKAFEQRIQGIQNEIDECYEVIRQMNEEKDLTEEERKIKVKYQLNIMKREWGKQELSNLYNNLFE